MSSQNKGRTMHYTVPGEANKSSQYVYQGRSIRVAIIHYRGCSIRVVIMQYGGLFNMSSQCRGRSITRHIEMLTHYGPTKTTFETTKDADPDI